MHPDIGNMLRETGYYPFLKNGDEEKLRELRRHRVTRLEGHGNAISKVSLVWINTPLDEMPWNPSLGINEGDSICGDRAALGGGYRNPFEATVIYRFLESLRTRRGGLKSLMILSPYRQQTRLLKSFFENRPIPGIPNLPDFVATVDSAQGRQAEVVIVSLVRNNPATEETRAFGFLTSKERAGVMFSRAESLLVVVGCSMHFAKGDGLGIRKLYDFIDSRGLVIDAKTLTTDADLNRLDRADKNRRGHISMPHSMIN